MAVERLETEIDLSGKTGGQVASPQEDELEIEVVDDTPEQDRGREPLPADLKSAIPEDDEIAQYGRDVQQRIKQMKREYHDERRAKEAWQREHQAAVDFAKRVFEENRKLRDYVTRGHKALVETTKGSAEAEVNSLKDALKTALDMGDTAKAADIQARMAAASARAEAQNHIQPIQFPEQEAPFPETQQPQAPQVSRRMQEWMEENPWFNQNKRMTAFAFGVHEELINDKGVPVESPRYFAELDRAMKESFPQYFTADEDDSRQNSRGGAVTTRPRGTPVAGVNRSPSVRSRTRVTLTISEKAVAKRLGLTENQYAQEKLRLENLDG